MQYAVIKPTTDAVTEGGEVLINKVPTSIYAPGLAGVEAVDLLYSADDGETWNTFVDDGAPVILSETNPAIAIYSYIRLAFTKSSTGSPVGVYIGTEAGV